VAVSGHPGSSALQGRLRARPRPRRGTAAMPESASTTWTSPVWRSRA